MAVKKISDNALTSAAGTTRFPASKSPFDGTSEGYLTTDLIRDYILQNKGVYIIAASASTLSHTGDTTETVLATIPIAANLLGANGRLRITTLWSFPSNANTKSLRVRFGGTGITGTVYLGTNATTTLSAYFETMIRNAGATNSQKGASVGGLQGVIASAVATSALDTTSLQNLYITAQCGNSGDTINLEDYMVELIKP